MVESLPALPIKPAVSKGTSHGSTGEKANSRPQKDCKVSFARQPSETSHDKHEHKFEHGEGRRGPWKFFVLTVGATGVVFGDIGTSPLYTYSGIFSSVLDNLPDCNDATQSFSMIFWLLNLIVLLKYIALVMRVDHHGEGGSFAILQTILSTDSVDDPLSSPYKLACTATAMLAVSLIAGDGSITPAITVLGALEGIPVAMNQSLKVALAVAILIFIFFIQKKGSQFIGVIAGPVCILWFLALGALGIWNLIIYPEYAQIVVVGLSPSEAIKWWVSGNYAGVNAWRSLAGIVLSVTGAEALYSDMGHFGAWPITVAWSFLIYPCLVLQYMGQAAALCNNPAGVASPLFNAVPVPLVWPMVVLATLAAIIASQAMVSALFSLLSQAHALKFIPRILVLHPNPEEPGQVYVPEVNWIVCFNTCVICIAFGSSANLAGAYGIAVTSTFVCTTFLLWQVMRRKWGWHFITCLIIWIPIFCADILIWSANIIKIVDSGWVPILIASVLLVVMSTYYWGRAREDQVMAEEMNVEISQLVRTGAVEDIGCISTLPGLDAVLRLPTMTRTAKTVVFLTPYEWRVPRTVAAFASTLGCLPETIVLLAIQFEKVPFLQDDERSSFKAVGNGIYTIAVRFGYSEPLTAERFSINRALVHVAREYAEYYPELQTFLDLDQAQDKDHKLPHPNKVLEEWFHQGVVFSPRAETTSANRLINLMLPGASGFCLPLPKKTGETYGWDSIANSPSTAKSRSYEQDSTSSTPPAVSGVGRLAALYQEKPERGRPNPNLTFVVNKTYYSMREDSKYPFFDRLRIALYSVIVLNARNTICYFGLDGMNSMEIAAIRYL